MLIDKRALNKAVPVGGIDLSAIKDAAEEPVAGLEQFGGIVYHAVLTRNGLHDLGECTPPNIHPETGKKVEWKQFHRIQVLFSNLMRLVKEERAGALVYNADSTLLSHLVPIVGMLTKVAFIGIKDQDLAETFGHKRKKEFVHDIKKSNPLPGKEVDWPSYAAVAYALFGIRLRAAEARRDVKPEITVPVQETEEKTTESGIILP